MAVKPILKEPNKILRQVSRPVKKVGKDEQKLINKGDGKSFGVAKASGLRYISLTHPPYLY